MSDKWYTKEEALATGLPCYISDNKGWTFQPYDFAVLLSQSRCEKFEIPILSSGRELPSAFRYENVDRYYPLYDRTDVFASGELDMKDLYDYEIMGNLKT